MDVGTLTLLTGIIMVTSQIRYSTGGGRFKSLIVSVLYRLRGCLIETGFVIIIIRKYVPCTHHL